MLKEKVKSDAALHSKNSRMQATQMVSLSLGSSKKNKFSNSKINSVRHNSNTKFKTTKSSPEKIEKTILPKEDQLAPTKLKPKQSPNNILNLNNNLTNNYNTILQKEVEKKANDFMLKKITKQQNKTKTKSNCLNFTNPVHPKTNSNNNNNIVNCNSNNNNNNGLLTSKNYLSNNVLGIAISANTNSKSKPTSKSKNKPQTRQTTQNQLQQQQSINSNHSNTKSTHKQTNSNSAEKLSSRQ